MYGDKKEREREIGRVGEERERERERKGREVAPICDKTFFFVYVVRKCSQRPRI